jgi:hypothetical protein
MEIPAGILMVILLGQLWQILLGLLLFLIPSVGKSLISRKSAQRPAPPLGQTQNRSPVSRSSLLTTVQMTATEQAPLSAKVVSILDKKMGTL